LEILQNEKFIEPFNEFINVISLNVMDIFEKAWDYAPQNQYLKSFYQLDENEDVFYAARELMDTILFKAYLFYTDTSKDMLLAELAFLEDHGTEERFLKYQYDLRTENLHGVKTRLLSLTGKEWAAEILGSNHALSNDFLNISPRIRGYFFYKGQNNKNVMLEHIASGK